MKPILNLENLKRDLMNAVTERRDLKERMISGNFPHRPARLIPAKRPFWAQFGKKPSPFLLETDRVEALLTTARQRHKDRQDAPLTIHERLDDLRAMPNREEVSAVADRPDSDTSSYQG